MKRMDERDYDEMQEQSWQSHAWFVTRWATGLAIDLALHLSSVFMAAGVYVQTEQGRFLTSEPGGVYWAVLMGAGAWTSVQAGRVWAKARYLYHCLPEVLEKQRRIMEGKDG